MRFFPVILLLPIALLSLDGSSGGGKPSYRIVEYRGLCDASGASYLDDGHFIVANDEDNTLRIYQKDGSNPVKTVPLDAFLGIDVNGKNPEADIEASTRIDDLIFWIGSHGRNVDGKIRTNRNRFFASKVDFSGNGPNITPVGRFYRNLVSDLLESSNCMGLGLEEAAGPHAKKNPELAPKEKGLNIEGISHMPGCQNLLIGFRNPVPKGKALLIPLLNPEGIMMQGEKAKFGNPILLDLGGLAVRSIDYVESLKAYLMIAGEIGEGNRFKLFTWSGLPSDPAVPFGIDTGWMKKEKFTPEAFVAFPESNELLLISDDGNVELQVPGTGDSCQCKRLSNPEDRRFRGAWMKLPL